MFQLWGKIWKDGHLMKDVTICDDRSDTRTHKILKALEKICREFDLGQPIWLDANIREFQKHSRTRFRQDNFMEEIDFDYLEIQVTEED